MSRYVLKQEDLETLLNQIKQLNRVNEAKDERIKVLERHKTLVSGSQDADFVTTIGELEEEIQDLKAQNRQLADGRKDSTKRIQELENLLEEETKLREYLEAFAKEAEQQCAKEALVRELTTELCQLQRDEIEIESRRILELQKKIKNLSKQTTDDGRHRQETRRHSDKSNASEGNALERDEHIRSVVRKLRSQLVDLYGQFNSNPPVSEEDRKQKKKVETWLSEIGDVMEDLNDIQDIRRDLSQLKFQIEDRRRSSTFTRR